MTDATDILPVPAEHPGTVLRQEYLDPLGLTGNALAMALRVPPPRISELLRGRRGVTADTALRLGRYFGTGPELWMALQAAYDLHQVDPAVKLAIATDIAPLFGEDKATRKSHTKALKRRLSAFTESL